MSRHWAVCLALLPSTTVSLTTASTACPSSHLLLRTLVILNQFLEQTHHILAWSLLYLNCPPNASNVIYSSLLIVYNMSDWIIKAFFNECSRQSFSSLPHSSSHLPSVFSYLEAYRKLTQWPGVYVVRSPENSHNDALFGSLVYAIF